MWHVVVLFVCDFRFVFVVTRGLVATEVRCVACFALDGNTKMSENTNPLLEGRPPTIFFLDLCIHVTLKINFVPILSQSIKICFQNYC